MFECSTIYQDLKQNIQIYAGKKTLEKYVLKYVKMLIGLHLINQSIKMIDFLNFDVYKNVA